KPRGRERPEPSATVDEHRSLSPLAARGRAFYFCRVPCRPIEAFAMFMRLLTSRRFAPLFCCQLCSALNDNFLRNALGMLILFGVAGSGAGAAKGAGFLIALAGVVFIAPSVVLSALGGELADRYDKALIARSIRLGEIPIAALAAIGFYFHAVPVLF